MHLTQLCCTPTGVMFTCDAFGAHYCEEDPFDSQLEPLAPHYRFYYDCLMRPNARSVLTALRKTADLEYTIIATGHGPILRHNLGELVGRRALAQPCPLNVAPRACDRGAGDPHGHVISLQHGGGMARMLAEHLPQPACHLEPTAGAL